MQLRSVPASSVRVIANRAVRTLRARAMSSHAGAKVSEHDRFMFDLNGFLVLRNVFSAQEVAAANAAIDAQSASLMERSAAGLRNASAGTPMAASGPRQDMGGMMLWPKPHCDIFRQVLAHPTLVPYLNALCGEGYRMDHQPMVIAQHSGSEGFKLHGGPISGSSGSGNFNPELQASQ